MTSAPQAPPLHSSVRTSTSLNTDAAGKQLLTVVTSRLVVAWRDGDMTVAFEMHWVRTEVLNRPAANAARKTRP